MLNLAHFARGNAKRLYVNTCEVQVVGPHLHIFEDDRNIHGHMNKSTEFEHSLGTPLEQQDFGEYSI